MNTILKFVVGLVAVLTTFVFSSAGMAADASKSSGPVVCVYGVVSPIPQGVTDANFSEAGDWVDQSQNLPPTSALEDQLIDKCHKDRGVNEAGTAYIFGLPFPREFGPLRRHVTLVLCMSDHILVYDKTIKPGKNFPISLSKRSRNDELAQKFCPK